MKTHVCLIDDDPDELDIFMDALNRMDMPCKCTSAESGEHALQMLGYLSPDFIFLDMNMPRMSGLECLVEIRKMHQFDKIPVILYSTGMNDITRARALALGAIGDRAAR